VGGEEFFFLLPVTIITVTTPRMSTATMSNDPLFTLIHSLTHSERRYFTLNAAGGRNAKKYLLLFETILHLEVYDEQVLRRILKGERFLNELHVAKNYLFEQIMKCLCSYNSAGSTYQILLQYLQEADILYRQGLPAVALKRLQKAKHLAKKYHHLSMWLHALERERIFLGNTIIAAKQAGDLKEEIRYLLDEIGKKNQFDEVSLLCRDAEYVTSANKKHIAMLKNKIEEWQASFVPGESDTRTVLSFYTMNARFYAILKDYRRELPYLKSKVELLRNNQEMVAEGYFHEYVALHEYFMCLYTLSFEPAKEFYSFEAVTAFIKRMESSYNPKNGRGHRTRFINCTMAIQSSWCLFMGEYTLGIKLLLESRKNFTKYRLQHFEYPEVAYNYYFTRMYFGLGEFSLSLEWGNKLLSASVLKTNTSLMASAKIMVLVVLFELGEYSYVARSLQPLVAYLKKNKLYHEYETLAIETLKQLTRKQSSASMNSALIDVLKQFSDLRTLQTETSKFLDFEFDWWLEAKIKNIPFQQMIHHYRQLAVNNK
jgi:hypothetical protein